MHSIYKSGIYYVGSNVTDKPVGAGGFYVLSRYNAELLVGKFISFGNDEYNIIYQGGSWRTYKVGLTTVTIQGTTTSSGALEIPSTYVNSKFMNALITTGGAGYAVRRDLTYLTVFNNDGSAKANTQVAIDAYFYV